MVLKVGVLLCDTPHPSLMDHYGDYGVLFRQLMEKTAHTHSHTHIEVSSFDVVHSQEYPPPSAKLDIIIITGSKFSAYEDLPWIVKLKEFVRRTLTMGDHRQSNSSSTTTTKVIGVCFGHQIVAEAMGGKVEKNSLGWEIGWTKMDLTDVGKQVLNTSRPSMNINSMHQDIVSQVPPNFQVLASTDICNIQSMYLPDRCITIQGHPEYSAAFVKELITLRRGTIFTEEFADQALLKCDGCPLDSYWFTEKCLRLMTAGKAQSD